MSLRSEGTTAKLVKTSQWYANEVSVGCFSPLSDLPLRAGYIQQNTKQEGDSKGIEHNVNEQPSRLTETVRRSRHMHILYINGCTIMPVPADRPTNHRQECTHSITSGLSAAARALPSHSLSPLFFRHYFPDHSERIIQGRHGLRELDSGEINALSLRS